MEDQLLLQVFLSQIYSLTIAIANSRELFDIKTQFALVPFI